MGAFNGESHVFCLGGGRGKGGEGEGGKGEEGGEDDFEYLGDVFDFFKWDTLDQFRRFLKSKRWEGGEGEEVGGRLKVLLLLGLLFMTPVPHIWCSEVIKACLEVVGEEGRKGEGGGDSKIVLFGFIFDFFDFLALKLAKEGKQRQKNHNNNTSLPLHPSVFKSPPSPSSSSSSPSSSSSLPPPLHLFTNTYQHCLKQWEAMGCHANNTSMHRANHFFRHVESVYSKYGVSEVKEEGGEGGRKRKGRGEGGEGSLPLKKTKKSRSFLNLERKRK